MARRARCDTYLPNFFSTLANGYEELGKMDSAMDANRKGMEIAKQTDNIEGLIISAYGLAKRYDLTEKSDTALSLLDSIQVWFALQSEPDSQKLGQAYELKGVIYLRRAENSSAEYYLSLAHSIYQQFPEDKYAIANIYFNRGEFELEQGHLKKAADFYKKGAELVPEWTDLYLLFESKVDLAKNMREKDWIFFALLFVSFTVAILSLLLYRKEKQLSFERLEKEKLKHDIVKNELMIICNKIALSNHAEPTVKEIKIRIERLLSRLGYQTQENSLNLRIFAEEMLSEGEVAAKMEIEPNLEYLEEYKLSPVLRDELDCIIKEAFINIGKHARATKAYFEVSVNDEGLNILIKDDGVGFDYHKTPKSGLKNLQSRIEEINGILDIVSKPGEGTHIHIIIPQFPEE
ncbi:MAG: ATP-binding protein [Bacteroidia bacterium]|nr:ATP-binding protein [Bacteroidia bacterium]